MTNRPIINRGHLKPLSVVTSDTSNPFSPSTEDVSLWSLIDGIKDGDLSKNGKTRTRVGTLEIFMRCVHFLVWVTVPLFAIFMLGCSRSHEFNMSDELCPTNLDSLVRLSVEDLERVDIGRMNLICAGITSSPSPNSELNIHLNRLDEWARLVRIAELKYRKSYERDPSRYDYSYAKFRAVNLVLTLKEEFKCRYQMRLVDSGELFNIHSPAFFRNPDDVFITGLLKHRRGTCTSYAPLIVAIGRRLGYPLYLKATSRHLFCFWDDGKNSFNLDTNGDGVDTPEDEYYFTDKNQGLVDFSKTDLERECFMRPLSAAICLSFFLETAGYCHEANNRLSQAQRFYNLALKYRPSAVNLNKLASRRFVIHGE